MSTVIPEEPEYRFEFKITRDGAEIFAGSTYIGSIYEGQSESVDMEIGSSMRWLEKEMKLDKERSDELAFGPRATEDEGDVVIEVPNGEDDFDLEIVGK